MLQDNYPQQWITSAAKEITQRENIKNSHQLDRLISYVESKDRKIEDVRLNLVFYALGVITIPLWNVVLDKPTEAFRKWYNGRTEESKTEVGIPTKLDPDKFGSPWADIALGDSGKKRKPCHRKMETPIVLVLDQLGRPRDPETGKTGVELLKGGHTVVLPNANMPLRLESARDARSKSYRSNHL